MSNLYSYERNLKKSMHERDLNLDYGMDKISYTELTLPENL